MIFLDTDHFSVATRRHDSKHATLCEQLRNATEPVFLPVVTVEEQLRGWLAQIHAARDEGRRVDGYRKLIRLIEVLPDWDVVPWDVEAAEEFIRQRKQGVRIGSQDLRIASLAITHDAILLTRNAKDFSRVVGLRFQSWLD
ncbi:MAG: type II toxin-antitoxin system VapC family toxin [Planctomycetaceae bacterium]|nr:type II toxin-antitoxin system VapC family toxin [Planctomycetaceae bacterium]